MQGPNELDGAASTKSDTLPLGVTTDHIISLLPSTPDNSINGLIDWDRGRCHNRFQRPGNGQAATLIYAGIKNVLELRGKAGVEVKLLFSAPTSTTRWHSWTIKSKRQLFFPFSFFSCWVFSCLCFISHHKVFINPHQSVEGCDDILESVHQCSTM